MVTPYLLDRAKRFIKSKIRIPKSKIGMLTGIVVFSVLLFSASNALSDDVGITKARLIQTSENSYVVEADVTQALVWAIKAPIFPDRFQVSTLEYINQSGWIVVQATATTSGEPLFTKDELLLPWMRNGASMTVQWLDGSIRQGLFLRSLEGIHIPLKTLLPTTRSLGEVVREHFFIGLEHLLFSGIHVLLVFVMVLLAPTRNVFTYLLFYTFGQAASMVLVDLGLPGFDLLFTDLLGAILVFLLAVAAALGLKINAYLSLLFLFGLLHGLSYAHEMAVLELANNQKLPALFMFNLGVDVGHFIFSVCFCLFFKSSSIFRTGRRSVFIPPVHFRSWPFLCCFSNTSLLAMSACCHSTPLKSQPSTACRYPRPSRGEVNAPGVPVGSPAQL